MTAPDHTTTYVDHARHLLTQRHPDLADEPVLLDHYALLVHAKAGATTPGDVHDAWSLWRSRSRPDHRSIIPFNQLAHDVQRLDQPYVDAIRAAAAALGIGRR
ncbi:DUF7701 domain-containing protein [Streptomonospora litoralis]|uniref:DUF7701 domain-containing protein n=1 Tax=Streptomonospora litoralis TaxID=2498135 RepID=A0A4P6Q2H6_9ACTN|nr:hypothetical protein [Streptomonospora litoralis]QBI53441.1 hypothetical protein EKD16_08235 [Streptomonospora litoralis]